MQTESSKNEMIKEEEEKERNASASIATRVPSLLHNYISSV